MIIKTNAKMRDLYAKHLNKLEDYANGNFKDYQCYLCLAANSHEEAEPNKSDLYGDCKYCPLPGTSRNHNNSCNSAMRYLNLKMAEGIKTWNYSVSTPASIRKHARWIEKQIVKRTDCEFEWEKER